MILKVTSNQNDSMSWEIQNRCTHMQNAGRRQHWKLLTSPQCQARARGEESFCHTSPSPPAAWEKATRGNGHSLTVAFLVSFCLFLPPLSGCLVLATAKFLIHQAVKRHGSVGKPPWISNFEIEKGEEEKSSVATTLPGGQQHTRHPWPASPVVWLRRGTSFASTCVTNPQLILNAT